MTIGIQQVFGRPGIGTAQVAQRRNLSRNGALDYYPAGGTIEGTKARDPGNSAYSTLALRPGLVMGKITSGGFWANSIIGLSNGAITGAATTLSVSAAAATEIVRRIGTTGTFKLTGPPTAAGTVRTRTVTYSAVNTSTGDITITALGTADVWTLTAPAGQDGGFYQLRVTTGKGTSAEASATTTSLAANANSATVDAALEALANVGAAGVVAVYADPTLTLTFASNLGPVEVEVVSDTTNDGGVFEGGWAAVHTTTGVDGRFVTLSLVQPTDGSETPLSFIPDGYGYVVPDDSSDVPFPLIPAAGTVDVANIIDYPSDASLKTWLKQSVSTLTGGKWIFSDVF